MIKFLSSSPLLKPLHQPLKVSIAHETWNKVNYHNVAIENFATAKTASNLFKSNTHL